MTKQRHKRHKMNITKKLLLVAALVTVTISLHAQTKKVAVMETKTNEGVTSFQSNIVRGGMETAVANAAGYEGYDRAAFDVILKEQNFQRSGAVNETQIARLGQMAGVQYVLVSEASKENEYFYILAKLLDVETGRFLKSADKLCDATPVGIKEACVQLGIQLFNGGSGISNARFGDRYTETAYGVNLQLVYVEGGEFEMGCTSEQGGDCGDDEFPVLRRRVNSYYIGIFEVTQSQWEKVMGTIKTDDYISDFFDYEGDDYPVWSVFWGGCREFCDRLSRQSGKTYRLPTEAEWEYAAKGGNKKDGTKYSGSNVIDEVAWYYTDDDYKNNNYCDIHKCGMKQPNGLGIYDMSGNVLEWCYDWYDFYSLEDTKDPMWNPQYHVVRGGSDCNDEWSCRVTCRFRGRSDDEGVGDNLLVGFRVVLVP